MVRWSVVCAWIGLVLCVGCSDSDGASGAGGSGGVDPFLGAVEIAAVTRLDSECLPSTDLGLEIGEGSWDLASSNPYYVVLVVETKLESELNSNQAELNTVGLSVLRVALLDGDGTPLEFASGFPNPYTVTASAVLPPVQGAIAPRMVVATVAVPESFADDVREAASDEMVVELQLVGTTSGGDTVRSLPLLWPVRLCDNCLAVECADPEAEEEGCLPGQDGDGWCGG